MAAETPPPVSHRAHTPPTPLHGARYDDYEPYSPRRSKRSAAASNPYGSSNTGRCPNKTRPPPPAATPPPPPTQKKARFARAATHLTSPPSSPEAAPKAAASAAAARGRCTPGKALSTPAKAGEVNSGSDGTPRLLPSKSTAGAPSSMIPTPAKTPRKHKASVHPTARILSFQPNDPNDVMPTPRKLKPHARPPPHHGDAFAPFDGARVGAAIDIYTDSHARVPEMDDAEDNPFVGPRKRGGGRGRRRTPAQPSDEALEEAARRDEGVLYSFRGRKIFKRFESPADGPAGAVGMDEHADQRSLKQKAGAAAQRPLTRSSIKPRLLFPTDEERRERAGLTDEEAMTDVETRTAASPSEGGADLITPHEERFARDQITPPPTGRGLRSKGTVFVDPPTPVVEGDDPEAVPSDSTADVRPAPTRKGEGRSPFDDWQRVKPGGRAASKKRAGDSTGGGPAGPKRTRSNATSPS